MLGRATEENNKAGFGNGLVSVACATRDLRLMHLVHLQPPCRALTSLNRL